MIMYMGISEKNTNRPLSLSTDEKQHWRNEAFLKVQRISPLEDP